MICTFKTVVVLIAYDGKKYAYSVNRDGAEVNILKEKDGEGQFRNYYCTNCKKMFDGETVEDWNRVKDHLGNRVVPFYDGIKEEDIIDYSTVDLEDPNLRPTIRKLVLSLKEVFDD